ncbi:alpha/beta fold hydrolase [Nocardia rhamnosiphila]|uniref:alpha/beta fold hydrolase n=1 Tax=Nocardia rhamnosiphila TaxID=426716 RepID=UPI0009DD1128|nr:alpha/beta hydrolase [Nocardia rhamnosiphila]
MALPVVLLHGIRLSGRCWVSVEADIGIERPVVTPDLPGHGARRGERFTMPAAIDTVRAAIDGVGGRALVVGHSLGGHVAIAASAELGERVAGLVAAGSTRIPNSALTIPFRIAHLVLSTQRDGGERLSRRLFDATLPAQVAAAVAAGGIATEVIPDIAKAAADFDPLGELRRYSGPVWLINGSRDHFRGHEQRFIAASPRARLLVVPRAGHYLPLAEPQRFARLIRDIADGCDARRDLRECPHCSGIDGARPVAPPAASS